MSKFNTFCKFAICAVVIALCGCSKGDDKKTATQVAAKVNDSEISLLQVNEVLRTAKNVNAENVADIKKQILEKLIDQQIVVDKALKDNLDRTPDVMTAIESAKKDILARAYLQKMIGNAVRVSDQDVKKYYDEHPELFSKRRIFNLQDIGVQDGKELLASLQREVEQQKTMQEIVDNLKSQNIAFKAGAYTRPAEQIPMELLPKLQQLQDGEAIVLPIANANHVIKIVKSESAPIELRAATPFIKNYFVNTKGKQVIDAEMKKYRAESAVEYFGEYATAEKQGASTVGKQGNDSEAKEKSSNDGKKSQLDKGISGLK